MGERSACAKVSERPKPLLEIHKPKERITVIAPAHKYPGHRVCERNRVRVIPSAHFECLDITNFISFVLQHTARGFINRRFAFPISDRFGQQSLRGTTHEKSILPRSRQLVHWQTEHKINQLLI